MMKKSPRVADESMLDAAAAGDDEVRMMMMRNNNRQSRSQSNHGWTVVICSILRAPLLCVSCLSHPHVLEAAGSGDRVWVTGDIAPISEINHHLMLNDGMRYAILMWLAWVEIISQVSHGRRENYQYPFLQFTTCCTLLNFLYFLLAVHTRFKFDECDSASPQPVGIMAV